MQTKPLTQLRFLGAGRIHPTVTHPKTGPGIGTCKDVRKPLTPKEAEYLWQRGQHRVRHARAVMLFHAMPKRQRLHAVLQAARQFMA